MTTIYYLAYGSNIHPLRLIARCPSAISLGVVELPNRIVRFAKRSNDGSGKCTLLEENDHTAYGVLYEMDAADKVALDKAEGLGNGYNEQLFQVPHQGQVYLAFSYVAALSHLDLSLKPYDWYKAIVVCGARHTKMTTKYVAELDAVGAIIDPDPSRRMQEYARLQAMGCSIKGGLLQITHLTTQPLPGNGTSGNTR